MHALEIHSEASCSESYTVFLCLDYENVKCNCLKSLNSTYEITASSPPLQDVTDL